MSEPTPAETRSSAPAVRTLPLAIAAVLGIAGWRLLMIGERLALSGGILLLVAGLAAAGVALGGTAYGAGREGRLDLSTRIGLGLLGGILAGLLHGVLTETSGWVGLPALVGASVDVDLSPFEWWQRTLLGGLWGLGFGILYPYIPGRSFAKKGMVVGVVLAAWQLFYVYPVRLGLGMAGLQAGVGVPVLVVAGTVLSAIVAASVVAWGDRAEGEPLSGSLVP
ncbi:MAG: hypothetical protein ACR2GQ_06160 [Gemmatimonadota bacterium]